MTLKVFELYSGIGGMHFALKESEIDAVVVKAIDINPSANAVYKSNFPNKVLEERNIQGLTEEYFNKLQADFILMSPPCQPHSRNGLRKDKSDQRSDSLLHIIKLLPKLESIKYLLLENVKGFEISEVRNELVEALIKSDYVFQEFLLSPTQFSIPNTRLRYYLLAKRKPLEFCFNVSDRVLESLPDLKEVNSIVLKLNSKYQNLSPCNSCFPLKLVLETEVDNFVPEKILEKYALLFDIVNKDSGRSCCFTKNYGRFVEGTGSVITDVDIAYVESVFCNLKNCTNESDRLSLLKSLNLRYFTPKEISRLMCFPENLVFPDNFTNIQKYKLLGNSINIHVVGILINILVS